MFCFSHLSNLRNPYSVHHSVQLFQGFISNVCLSCNTSTHATAWICSSRPSTPTLPTETAAEGPLAACLPAWPPPPPPAVWRPVSSQTQPNPGQHSLHRPAVTPSITPLAAGLHPPLQGSHLAVQYQLPPSLYASASLYQLPELFSPGNAASCTTALWVAASSPDAKLDGDGKSSSFGIPMPNLINFTTGKESDFLLLKKGLDSVLGSHPHLSEDYRFQVLLDHLKFPTAF